MRSYICVLGVSMMPLYTIVLFGFGTVPTVWYCFPHFRDGTKTIYLLWVRHQAIPKWARVMVMVFNATFNNISDISRRSVLLVEETGVHVDNHRTHNSSSDRHWFHRQLKLPLVFGITCLGKSRTNTSWNF